jgi:hypothetical protein
MDNDCLEKSLGKKSEDQGGDCDAGIEDDGEGNMLNESYEEVEEETSKTVDFSVGQRIEFAMHFNYPAISMDCVREFVLKAPVSGWMIEVQQNFTSASLQCSDEQTYSKAMKYCLKNAVKGTRFAVNKVLL